jgi:hypothetical protein
MTHLRCRVTAAGQSPSFQVNTTDDGWAVDVPLPGVDPKNVNLEVAGTTLTIRAEEPGDKGERWLQHEAGGAAIGYVPTQADRDGSYIGYGSRSGHRTAGGCRFGAAAATWVQGIDAHRSSTPLWRRSSRRDDDWWWEPRWR